MKGALCVPDILSGAAGTLFPDRHTVIVKLQRDADDLVTVPGKHRRNHR